MNNQFFSVGIQLPNPAESGFLLNFSATEADQHASFATGLAGVNFQRPPFEITGINFSGLNTLEVNDGDNALIDQVDFNLKISGKIPTVFDTENNSGVLNIEKVLVFTGKSESALDQVAPEFANFIVSTDAVNSEDDPLIFDINFSLSEDELNSNTGVIFYRLLPFDRLGSGKLSDIVSGQMFTGFPDLESFNEPIVIGRSNLNDLRFHSQRLILESGATGIGIDKENVKADFVCAFELRTDEEVVITGRGGVGILSLNLNDVNFVNPPNFTFPVNSGVAISGNFQRFTLERDTTSINTYIVRKAEG
jgi:hypothetical protein